MRPPLRRAAADETDTATPDGENTDLGAQPALIEQAWPAPTGRLAAQSWRLPAREALSPADRVRPGDRNARWTPDCQMRMLIQEVGGGLPQSAAAHPDLQAQPTNVRLKLEARSWRHLR
ncbi:MAG: hypothetical protein Q8S20_16415 [Sulfuritalea sp.]|nr:hypothetical protein [Sulfuritalea sp.]